MSRFPENKIVSLVGEMHRHELGESIGPDLRLAELLDVAETPALGQVLLGYASAEGDLRLRKIIAAEHGVSPEDVVVTIGGVQALFLIAYILCDRGDEAVVMSPLFPPARSVLDIVGADLRVLSLTFDQGYQIDLADLRSKLSARTKLVSLSSPQNPSGVSIPERTIRDILAMMTQYCPEAYLLVDETYRQAAYGIDPVAQSASGLSAKVISVSSLSKSHGAPGLRIGWAITRDPALLRQLVLGKFNTAISCSPVDEALALKLLAQKDRILAERRHLLAEGLAKTADWIRANQDLVEWVQPDAGALCCVRLRPSIFDATAVDRFYAVLAEMGVGVADGRWFGDEAGVFRLGFGFRPMPAFQAALDALAIALRRAARAAA